MKNLSVPCAAACKKNKENKEIYGWVVVAAGFLLILVLYGSYYCFGVFLKPMTTELGWERGVTSGAMSVYMVIHGACSILMGSLSDKYGPRYIVAFSTIMVALSYCLLSTIIEPFHFYLYFGVMAGIGMGAGYVPLISTVTRWFTVKRGLALGITASGVGVGQMIIPPLIRYMINIYGWRESFIIVGAIIFFIGVPSALLLSHPDDNTDPQSGRHIKSIKKKNKNNSNRQNEWVVTEAIRTSAFQLLLLIFMFLLFGIGILLSHLIAHVDDLGIDPMKGAFLFTLIGGGGIVGRVIIGGIADRTGWSVMLGWCLMLQALLFFCLIWADKIWEFYIIAVMYGLTYGGTLPVILLMISGFFGVGSGGAIFGILLFGATAGGAFGAPLAGFIFDVTRSYAAAFFIGGIVLTGAAILSFIIKPPNHKC